MARQSLTKSIQRATANAISQLSATYKKTTLPTGLRVVTEQIPYVRSVSIGIWIEVGSRDEDSSFNGLTHFIEHMVFKGTENRSAKDISRSIEAVGGYLNAFTGKEHTCYYARVLDEYLELALEVLVDLVTNASFPEKDLEKEKGVVIEELRNAEDDPDDIIHDYLERALYGNHSMGFPIIGTEENLRRFAREDLVSHYERYYNPARLVVAAAGNVEHAALVEMISKAFGKGNHQRRRRAAGRQKPRPARSKTVEVKKPIQQAHICLGTGAYGIKSRNRYPLLVLNTLLGDGMSSRLFQNIRERYGFAYSVYSFTSFLSDVGSFGVYIGTDRVHIDASQQLIRRELDKLMRKPISGAELERTKAQLKGNMMLSLESIPNRMLRLGSSELYFQELSPMDSILKKIDSVNQEDLQRVANDLFGEQNFVRVIFRPDEKNQTTDPGPTPGSSTRSGS